MFMLYQFQSKRRLGRNKEGKSKGSMCKLIDEGRLIRKALLWKLESTPNQEILARLESRGMKLSPQALHKIHFFEIVSGISSTYKNKTEDGKPSSVNSCGRRESNPYASRHQILSLACLPISTRPQ